MPQKPKRPCSYALCPKLTDGRYCEEHQKKTDSDYNKYKRNPAHKKLYGRTWKRIRDRHIKMFPLCEECKQHGKLTQAEEVHHILPLSKGGTHAEENLMSLCTSCHSKITAQDGDRWNAAR